MSNPLLCLLRWGEEGTGSALRQAQGEGQAIGLTIL